MRKSPPLGRRPWTHEEEQYLMDKWGSVAVDSIAKKLNRTRNAIVVRVQRLGLSSFLESGEYVVFNQLMIALRGGKNSSGYSRESWVQKRGLPVHYKKVRNCKFTVVYLDEFWAWAKEHRSFIDFSKMEPLALGAEPDWVAEQRRKDFASLALQRKGPWSSEDDSRLKMLLAQHKYGYAELSAILRRSTGAIQHRCLDLGLKDRPVRKPPHGKDSQWSDDDYQILADGIRNGDSYTQIGNAIGKSEKAVRGKVYYEYLTENQDKVRAMLGDLPWGGGAPDPTVKQGRALSRTKTEVHKNISALVGLLQYRADQFCQGSYWQRLMCEHWDPVHGCAMNCGCCDDCADFVRIKPQYCSKCGRAFYERSKSALCSECRITIQKQRLNGGM